MPPAAFTVALAQPRAGGDVGRIDWAVDAVQQAAALGAELLLFPEGYPGPMRATERYDAAAPLAAAAAAAGCAVCWSRVEATDDGRFHMVGYLHGPHGGQVGRYVRSHPATGDVHQVLSGTPIAPGPRLADLVDLGGVRVGLLVCSELWLPEIARVLAIHGAEVLLAPAGGAFGPLRRNWRIIARARAIENHCYVAVTQSLFADERGLAMVAGPEDDVAELAGEGVLVARLDLQRPRWLRAANDSMAEPKPSVAGLLRARRPELYGDLATAGDGLYDYDQAATPAPSTT